MSVRLDLAGKKIGSIRVLSFSGISEKGGTLWLCRCDRCGRDFQIQGHRLSGKNPRQDCGCAHQARLADLTGQEHGALLVLRRDGSYPSGDRGYICRCSVCGKEKRMPGSTIRTNPKSCGCARISLERISEMSKLGVDATVVDGCQVYSATREEANANSAIGLRWVHSLKRKNGIYIYACFYLKGRRYYRGGFSTPESAYEWALGAHRDALAQEGIEDPRSAT